MLVRFLVQPVLTGLGGKRHHGCAVHVGIGHAGDEIGRAGPQRGEAHPGLPVSRPYTSAMNAAPCSWRVMTKRMGELSNASSKSMFSSDRKSTRLNSSHRC